MVSILSINPNLRRNRQEYNVRGVITSVTSKTSGWWIFKETKCWLEVMLDPDHLRVLNLSLAQQTESGHCQVENKIEIFVPESEFAGYVNDRGRHVILTFGVAGRISQFFQGQNPVILMGAVKLDTV